ncbi:hypothetical protein DOTSEDRAFT_69058 [Dothistroma septosporum NZE10]|uniref:NmrA-like domain-containing protein n=1 Tax=Dothistroma septosporum (strain NZE10 / CBS 128990) TaxID=675120 RepID=N1Q4Q9_DOTSN|nr:hypothetical protein DOTSEDRAFT_69058 [Dothistroma septosporum NZE10]
MSKTVIVFGPTGNIGSHCARTASQHGAKVWLAMRDTSKSIPGLSSQQEKDRNFSRVKADLTDPVSVSSAVAQSGAKNAFIYAAHGSKDAMRSTIQALKDAGIELVVFLSSFTIPGPIREVPKEEVIPYWHAMVEISLEDMYGAGNFVAIRPGGFATNCLRWADGVKSGQVSLYGPKFKMDCITPGDMGRVSGTILANGPMDGDTHVYLYGPKLLTQQEMAETIGKVMGRKVEVKGLTPEQAEEQFLKSGVPKPVIDYMVLRLSDNEAEAAPRPNYEQGLENITKYTGRQSQPFEGWVSENKELFT